MQGLFARLGGLFGSPLVRGSVLYLFAGALSQGLGFMLIPIWTAYLDPGEFGILAVLAAIVQILVPIMMLGLHGSVVREYARTGGDSDTFDCYFSSCLWAILGLCALVLPSIGFVLAFVPDILPEGFPFWPFVPLALAMTAVLAVVTLARASLGGAELHAKAAGLDIFTSLSNNGLGFLLVVVAELGVLGRYLGILLSNAGAAVAAATIFARSWWRRTFDPAMLRAALDYGLPLVPHILAGIVLVASDRIMLARLSGPAEAGLYSFAASISALLPALFTPLNSAWRPRFFRLMSEGDPRNALRAQSFGWIGFVCLAVVAGAVVLPPVIQVLADPAFHPSLVVLPLLMLEKLFSGLYFVGSGYLYYFSRTKIIPFISGFAALVNIGLNLWLIPQLGATGAALTSVIACCLMTVLVFACSRRTYQYPLPVLWSLFGLFGTTTVCLVAWIFHPLPGWLAACSIIVALIWAAFPLRFIKQQLPVLLW